MVNYWTEEEIGFLKKNYPQLGAKQCALEINRDYTAVKAKASRLGLEKLPVSPLGLYYTDGEIQSLSGKMVCRTCCEEKLIKSGFRHDRNRNGIGVRYRSQCKVCDAKLVLGKICKTCGKAEDFISGAHGICRKCHNKKAREVRTNAKLKAINYLGGVCQDCKKEFPTGVYDLHHRDPLQKEMMMSRIIKQPWNKIKQELDKCDLLCANCHRIRHINEKKEI